jgi:hypothetical protein
MANNDRTSLRLETSKPPLIVCGIGMLVFFFADIFLPTWPQNAFVLCFRIVTAPFFLYAAVVLLVGVMTNHYDSVLTEDGITIGIFPRRKMHYRWDQIQAVFMVRDVGGTRVCLRVVDSGSPDFNSPRRVNLSNDYGMSAQALAQIILDWQSKFGAKPKGVASGKRENKI